jgi:hypothetical protein
MVLLGDSTGAEVTVGGAVVDKELAVESAANGAADPEDDKALFV